MKLRHAKLSYQYGMRGSFRYGAVKIFGMNYKKTYCTVPYYIGWRLEAGAAQLLHSITTLNLLPYNSSSLILVHFTFYRWFPLETLFFSPAPKILLIKFSLSIPTIRSKQLKRLKLHLFTHITIHSLYCYTQIT